MRIENKIKIFRKIIEKNGKIGYNSKKGGVNILAVTQRDML